MAYDRPSLGETGAVEKMAYDGPSLVETGTVEKMAYEKPILEEQEGLVFPEEIWQEFNQGHWCFGCTNCNCS